MQCPFSFKQQVYEQEQLSHLLAGKPKHDMKPKHEHKGHYGHPKHDPKPAHEHKGHYGHAKPAKHEHKGHYGAFKPA